MALLGRLPATRLALVGAAEQRNRCPEEDLQVDARGTVLDVPEVELYSVRPRQAGSAVDLRPAGDPGVDVEAVALPLVVGLDLVAQRRPRPDQRHLAAHHIPEL